MSELRPKGLSGIAPPPERTRRGNAGVPSDHHILGPEQLFSDVRNDQERATRAEKGRLDEDLPFARDIRMGLLDNHEVERSKVRAESLDNVSDAGFKDH